MSVSELPAGPAGRAAVTPFIPASPPPPPNEPPTVTIDQPTGRIRAGIPTTITVRAFEGVRWFFIPGDDSWESEPWLTYADTTVGFDNGGQIRDHTGGGGVYSMTFPTPGDHTVQASCTGTDGEVVTAPQITVHVIAANPPAFTIAAPTAGTVVPVPEGGKTIDVRANVPAGPPTPITMTATVDGVTTNGQQSGSDFVAQVNISQMPLGPRTITVGVADADAIASTKTVTVTAADASPPHLTVEFPDPGHPASVIGDGTGKVTVAMHGKAVDNQSGMVGGSASVAWALTPDGTPTLARPVSGSDFSSWQADVVLTGFGGHTIYVWATDQAGNTTTGPLPVPVVVISDFVPKTLEERLDEREYLAALMAFAQEQVRTSVNPDVPLDTAALIGVLGQPLDRLSQPLSATLDQGGREINQLRVPVELLRARIAATHTDPAPGAAGEVTYRSTAYAALLAAFGTSYAELRLARGAGADVRTALAARLGIRLSPTTPDELDRLVLDGPTLTEAALETLFGLPNTTATDPLRVPPTPLLRTWQLAGLSAVWAEQDQHPNPPRAFAVLVDPDVVGTADIAPGSNSDPIRTLLAARTKLLADYATMLDGLRTATSDPVKGLTDMQNRALPGVDLAGLETKDGKGIDTAADLAAAGLTRPGFRYLRKLARLTAAGQLTAAEWADAVAILTGAHKRSLYPDWRVQESGFVLSPDFFVLADPAPEANPYRVDAGARNGWRSVLRSRIAQRQNLLDATDQAVAVAEQAALPILRDALLADLKPTPTTTIESIGEEMSARFLVDMLAGGSLRTTRIRQAIESVQSLLSAKRSGELTTGHPAFAWTLANLNAFSNAWVWLGEWGSWQAATMAFLFAERHLDPTLVVPAPTTAIPKPAMGTLLANLRDAGPVTGAAADVFSAQYLSDKKVATSFTYLDPLNRVAHQDGLRTLSTQVSDVDSRETFWAVPVLLAQRLQAAGDYRAALDWYWLVYPYDVENAKRVSIFDRINKETPSLPDLTFPTDWTAHLNPFELVANRPMPFTRYSLLCIIRCHLDFADAEFARETDESVAHARTLYLTALRLLGSPALRPQAPTNPGEATLAIPELDTLRLRATVALAKLRQGRNIAGMPRTQAPTAAVTISQPTPFRFKVLMERARQLTAQAIQMEAGYLAALEKYDDRSLRIFDALKGIDLTRAQVALSASRVKEADDAVTAAVAQQTKADTMVSTYGDLIDAPPNRYEQNLLDEYPRMRLLKDGIVAADTVIAITQAAMSAASLQDAIFSGGAKVGLALTISGAEVIKGGLEVAQNELEAQMQANQLKAGIEQRRQEWRVQQTAARQESLVAAAQVTVANDQVTIAVQERGIANLQHDQAVATLKFLGGQFTNADLYLWMSTNLGGVYRYFLQQATATARLAQAQLGFERAEVAQTLIRNDYWQTPTELTAAGAQLDRRGLTGAEQLSADLTRLEEYALRTERRRLNLSRTFSLARLMPVEFLDFRRTGTLAFATPMALFDADFPGHYLRMIRQVRTSLVALVPQDRGICATLYSNGISRVTTRGDGTFSDVVVRHDPAVVALTSPTGASGVFEMDTQSDMLLPFESSGVDTTWELRLPPAANPMDFSSIVDVLITVDYTALSDEDYRAAVITRLNANRDSGADRVYSLARDFPDQWYDLNNPVDPGDRSVTLILRDLDFPLGISSLSTAAVAVRLSSGTPVPDTVVTLTRGATGGDATATSGIASTRRGNAPTWIPLVGSDPTGEWRLRFGADGNALLDSGALDDILLVVSWSGQSPAWTL
jgi:hypothetical protein